MITGAEIRAARKRAGLSQAKLAEMVGVVERTVGGWEREESAPGIAEPRLLAVLREHLDDGDEPPLKAVSDVELLAEIARRFARREQPRVDVAWTQDGPEPKVKDVLEERRRRESDYEFVDDAAATSLEDE